MRTVVKGLIGQEDLQTGSGSFTRANSLGGTSTLTKLGVGALVAGNLYNVRVVDGVKFTTIQAAVSDLPVGGGVVYLPAGTYTQDTALTLASDVSVLGAGQNATIITTTLSSGALFAISAMKRVNLRGFKISKSGSAGGSAIQLKWGQWCNVEDIEISGNFSVGLDLQIDGGATGSTIYNHFKDILITGLATSGNGVNLLPSGGKVVNDNRFFNIVTGPNTNGSVIGFNDQGGHENIIVGGDYSTGDTNASTIGIKAIAATRNLLILGATIESNNVGLSIAASAEGVKYIGCTLNSNTTQVSDSGNRSVCMADVSGTTPNWSLDKSGNMQLNAVGLGGAGASLTGSINGTTGWVLGVSGSSIAQVNSGNLRMLQDFLAKRIKASEGTALVAGDFALSAGWGTTASVGTITGTDQANQFTVTSSGTGQGASPTITLTFKDGTWTNAPIIIVKRAGGNQLTIVDTWTVSPTVLTITFNGTPVAAETYTYVVHVIGR